MAYSTTSPYYGTPTWGPFLDIWRSKTITPAVSDAIYQIDMVYHNRPDLLAHDLYQDTNLWWVFAVRNPDTIRDPIFDFRTGVVIHVPTKATLTASIGI